MKNCLIIIDMQNDFITGSLGTKEACAIVPVVKERIEKAIKEGDDLIFTEDTHTKDYLSTKEGQKLPIEHCIEWTEGHHICPELEPYTKSAKKIINKNTFGYKDLPLYVAPYDTISLIGLCTDVCVISNAILLKAFYPEKNYIIEEKCCAGTTPENHEIALKALKLCQFDVI